MKIQILDIDANSKFDADVEKDNGTDGVIIKGGQGGAIYPHRHIIAECQRVSLPWGIYWLPDARYNPDKAKAAIRTAFPDGDFGALGLWLDCEKPLISMKDYIYRMLPYAYYKPIESISRSVLAWSGKQPKMYTGLGPWALIFGRCPEPVQEYFAQADLWAAQYNSHITEPQLFGAWKKWKLWQYMEGPDYSIFNGTEQEYSDWVGGYTQPVPDPEPLPSHFVGHVVSYTGVNLRENPIVTSKKISVLPKFTDVFIDQIIGDWAHVTYANGIPKAGWAALRVPGLTLIRLD